MNLTLTLAAVAVAASAVRNAFAPPVNSVKKPEFVSDWRAGLPIGQALAGDTSAPMTVVVLSDFECPACAGFHGALSKFLAENPKTARAVYIEYPLPYHKYAMPAARAAECAATLGKFPEWTSTVFAQRDSLGRKGWGQLAHDAGIRDTAFISKCADEGEPNPRIQAGLSFGATIGLTATPTVLINGWRYHRTPRKATLDSALTAILKGKRPT